MTAAPSVIRSNYGFLKIDYNGSAVLSDGNAVGLKFTMVDLTPPPELVVCVYHAVRFYTIIRFSALHIPTDWIVRAVIDLGDIFLGRFLARKLDAAGNYDGPIILIIVEGKMGISALKTGKVCIIVVLFVVLFVRPVLGTQDRLGNREHQLLATRRTRLEWGIFHSKL